MRRLLESAILPSGFATSLLLAGLAAVVVRRTRKLCLPLLAGALAALLIFSNGVIPTLPLSPVESIHSSTKDPRQYPDARIIVVLTAYAVDNKNLALSARMNGSYALRILDVANLHSRCADCRGIFSGSATAANTMRQKFLLLGVSKAPLLIDGASNATPTSAERVKTLVGDGPFFQVTSAGHTRRAVGVFRRDGLVPIPAPTDYLLPGSTRNTTWTLRASHLKASPRPSTSTSGWHDIG
jgi:uncharacterized SAM-binding protein YcdF (DUF218 family)